MTGEAISYAYEPLKDNEIRILSLLPGLPGSELRCVIRHDILLPKLRDDDLDSYASSWESGESEDDILEHKSSDSKLPTDHERRIPDIRGDIYEWPDFEALSYVWGSQDPPRSLCHYGSRSGFLTIGPNLHDALERLRPVPGQEARTLWVDQICINQSDREERSAQVQKMGDIFKAARKVLIWLGQEDEYTALGFDFARSVYEKDYCHFSLDEEELRRLSEDFAERVPRRYMDHHFDRFGNISVEKGVTEWCAAALNKITYRSWFERTWTFQEVKLARNAVLICGSQSLPWEVMDKFLSIAFRRDFYRPNQDGLELTKYLECSYQSYAFRSSFHGGIDFLGLLAFRKKSKCSDPRDKVVALLGLADDLDEGLAGPDSKPATEFICPDYQETVEDLYLKTAHYLVQSTQSLKLLWLAIPTSTPNNLPSWVPDWRHTEFAEGTPDAWFQRASRGSTHSICLTESALDRTQLRVSGIKQDCISTLIVYDENFEQEFFRQPHGAEIYLPTMQPIAFAIKQTMMRENWANTDHTARAVFFGLDSRVVSDDIAEPSVDTFEEQLSMLNDRFRERDSAVQVFRGAKGFIGFGPRSMQVGDEIRLLLGLDCPVALRPTEGGYRFVGCCYVHGLMYGEGLHPSRRPLPCNYPGSSKSDEFWPLSWSEQKVKEENACRSPCWLTFEGEREANSYFEDHFQELIKDGYISDPSWKPPRSPYGEETLWLLERGFDPIPIITEDIGLV